MGEVNIKEIRKRIWKIEIGNREREREGEREREREGERERDGEKTGKRKRKKRESDREINNPLINTWNKKITSVMVFPRFINSSEEIDDIN